MPKPNESSNSEDFYSELDQAKKHSCTCGSFLLFIGFLLVNLSFIVYFLVKQIKDKVSVPEISISQSALEQAESKLQSFLKGKSNAPETVSLTLTDQEFTSLLVKSELLSSDNRYSLKNPSAVITPSAISISAFITKPIQSQIKAEVKPIVENGQLDLELLDISAGSLAVPKFLRGGVKNLLSRLVVSRLNDRQIIYERAVLGSHLLTLSGKKR